MMRNKSDTLPKIWLLISLMASVYAYGVFSYMYDLFPYTLIRDAIVSVDKAYEDTGSIINILKPTQFLQPGRQQGEGVTVNKFSPENQDLILMAGFFEDNNGIRLIKRNGEVIAKWNILYSEIFPDSSYMETPPASDWNVDTDGTIINPDGSVVFNFEYAGLVKLNRCGEVEWALPLMSHHSVERAEKGGYWVPGRRRHKKGEEVELPLPHLKEPPFYEDTLMLIADDGNIIREISVPKLFNQTQLLSLLTANGESISRGGVWRNNWDREIFHLNKVIELPTEIADAFPMFNAGDLLISLRDYNMIMVTDPRGEQAKWWKVGPWLRQHDPEFNSSGMITLFNNNVRPNDFDGKEKRSNIIEINPKTGKSRIVYGNKDGQDLWSRIRGKVDLTDGDRMLITEFEGGRVIEVDSSGEIVWEYINRYDKKMVAEVTEARVYNSNYFNVRNWSCE